MVGDVRKRRLFDDDLFGDFEKMQELLEEMMAETLTDFEAVKFQKNAKPLVYGFSFKMGQNGRPVVNEFGNVQRQGKKVALEEREPLVDVIDEKDQVKVIAELPGVSKEEVKLSVKGNSLGIRVVNPERRYVKDVRLPVEVSKNAKASFKNGILEVVLKKV